MWTCCIGARATGQMLLRKASALSLICYLNPCSYSPPPSFQGSIMAVWLDCLTVDWLDMTMLFDMNRETRIHRSIGHENYKSRYYLVYYLNHNHKHKQYVHPILWPALLYLLCYAQDYRREINESFLPHLLKFNNTRDIPSLSLLFPIDYSIYLW